jgi:hypothetical protein
MGAGLPADEALMAHARVEQRAQAYRAAGVKRPIDILRVAAYLDLLNGVPAADRVARFRGDDRAQAEDQAGEESGQAAGDAGMRAAARRAAAARAGRNQPGTGDSDPAGGSAPGDDDSGSSAGGPGPDEHSWDCPPDDYWPPEDYVPPDEPPCPDCGWGDCRCGDPRDGGTDDGDMDDRASGDGTHHDDGGPGNGSLDSNEDGDGRGDRGGSGDSGTGPGPRPAVGAQGRGSTAQPGQGVASEVNLTLRHLDIPFLTALGRAHRPGEARSLGILDPALARRLAEAAARHPDSKFCVTIVNREGQAIGHGCAKPRKTINRGNRRRQRKSGKRQRDGPPPTPPPSPAPAPAFTFIPRDDPGPPGGFGSWVLTLAGRTAEYIVDLHPVPTGQCGHQYQSGSHDPGALLRHLVTVRDGKCGFPTCSRHASESDFEHARPFDQGGPTCGCNCWSCSRSCHQLKQSDGWAVTETMPGYHQWTTPSGRIYTQEPRAYPA